MIMKTVKEWIDSVEDREVRDFLLERWDLDYKIGKYRCNIWDAIAGLCDWGNTIEGKDFWDECSLSPDPIAYLRNYLHSMKPKVSQPYYGPKDSPHEVHKFISAHNLNFNRGCVVKYAVRAGRKDPKAEIKDLEKAIDYLRFEIERLKEL